MSITAIKKGGKYKIQRSPQKRGRRESGYIHDWIHLCKYKI